MDRFRREQDALLKEHNAVLLRDRKHEVWVLPNGQKFTRSRTPSDVRSTANQLFTLKAALGLREAGGAVGERRDRMYRKPHKVTVETKMTNEVKVSGGSLAAFASVLRIAVNA
jgi:hypothetical protein